MENFASVPPPLAKFIIVILGVTINAQERIHERSAPAKGMAKTHDVGVMSGRGKFLGRSAYIDKVY